MNTELLDDFSRLDSPEEDNPKPISEGAVIRFLAIVLDVFCLAVIMNVLGAMLDGFYLINLMQEARAVGSILGIVLVFFYYPILESSRYQASIGKHLLSIKVVDEKGQQLTFGRALARFLASCIACMIVFIGVLMIAFTDKRGMHDMMTDTYVVKNKKR